MFMNKEGPYRDQAERLRKRITKKASDNTDSVKEEMPPRSRVHRNKKAKKGLKVKYPMIRLLALFFVLLPIIIFVVYSYSNWGESETTTASSGFETVGYGSNSGDQKKSDSEVIFEIDEQMDEKEEQTDKVDKQQDDQTPDGEPAQQKDEKDSNKSEDQVPDPNKEPVETPNNKKEEPSKDKDTESSEQAGGKIVYHTVKAQETLYRVSMNYYSSPDGVEIIKKANGLVSNEIQAGQVLKIPLN